MKVLHIGKYFPPEKGGMENFLRDIAVGLSRRGVDVAVLVHLSGTTWRTVRERYQASGYSWPVVRVAAPLHISFAPVSFGFLFQLQRTIREFRPDILHLHLPNASALWALLSPSARRLPWVVHWHSDVVASRQRWMPQILYRAYRPIEQSVLRRSAAIVATSQAYLDSSESLADYRDRCSVIPLGLDTSRLGGEPSTGAGAGKFSVLAVGRLTYYKGFEHLVRAMKTLDGVELHIVGSGDHAVELRELSAMESVQDKVRFHGEVGDRELAALYRSCDCVCLPSVERTEAFGLVLLEAMYCGKPTVVSDIPGSGMGWVVENGITGLKVPPGSPAALASALACLRDDRDLARKLGANGRSRFDARFRIDVPAGDLVELYHNVGAAVGGSRHAGG